MKIRMWIMISIIVVVLGGTFGWDLTRTMLIKNYFAHMKQPAVTVDAATVQTGNWTPMISTVGDFVANNGVDVTSEVSGKIKAILFKSGETVKTGQALIQLDDSIEQAQLLNNQSALKLAQLNFKRISNLYKKAAVSLSEYDASRAKLQQAQASLAQTSAMIAQKNIKAPFDGKLGIRMVNLGEFITPGQTRLTTLQAQDPMLVRFSLPEQQLPKIHVGQTVVLTVDAYPHKKFQGEIKALDSKVNINTHNVLIQAQVPNANSLLVPGMFANVSVLQPIQHNVLTVPNTAINYSLYGDSVFIITAKPAADKNSKKAKKQQEQLQAHRRFVRVGQHQGNKIVILKGLKAGDLVASSGQLKLFEGSVVTVKHG